MKTYLKILVMAAVLAIALSALTACSTNSADGYRLDNIQIYQNTPAWKLAKAVKSEVTGTIAKIAKENPELLDYQDPVYGTTLLCWAVGMEKYNSAEALLKAGANPDIISTYVGGTALYLAAGYSYVDTKFDADPKYVKLLLEYGADPEIGFVGNDHNKSTDIGETPLMASIGCGLEKTKALIEGGADINVKTQLNSTAAIDALLWGSGNMRPSEREYAYYLIVEKKADVTGSYQTVFNHISENPDKQLYPADILRDWVCELDSDDYKRKMEIVDEFARQGIYYWATEIPKYTLEHIQKLYPNTWEEYILRY